MDRPNKQIIYPMALFLLLIFGYNNKRRKDWSKIKLNFFKQSKQLQIKIKKLIKKNKLQHFVKISS